MRSSDPTTAPPRMRRDWPTIAVLCLALGLGTIALGTPWTWLDQGGWPWTDSISQTASGYEVTVTHPGGRTETSFRATMAEASAWVDRRNEELKHAYQLDSKIAVGHGLITVGSGLAVIGGAVLVGRLLRAGRGRSAGNHRAASVG